MSDPQAQPQQDNPADSAVRVAAPAKSGLIGPLAADIIGGISSLSIAIATATGLIKERAYKNLSSLHVFEDLKDARQIEGEDLTSRLKPLDFAKGVKDQELQEKLKHIPFPTVGKDKTEARKLAKEFLKTEEAQKEFENLVVKYGKLAEERMQEAGAGTLLKKWGKLRGHQKSEVIVTSLAYGGVALGSILLFTRGLFSAKQEQELAQKGSDQQQR